MNRAARRSAAAAALPAAPSIALHVRHVIGDAAVDRREVHTREALADALRLQLEQQLFGAGNAPRTANAAPSLARTVAEALAPHCRSDPGESGD